MIWGFRWKLAFVWALQLLFEAAFDRATNRFREFSRQSASRRFLAHSCIGDDNTYTLFFEYSFYRKMTAPKYRPCGFETISAALLRTKKANSRISKYLRHKYSSKMYPLGSDAPYLQKYPPEDRGLKLRHAWKMLRNAFARRFQSRVTCWTSAEHIQELL